MPPAAHKDAIATLQFAQDFGLDRLGNWKTFDEDADGGWPALAV